MKKKKITRAFFPVFVLLPFLMVSDIFPKADPAGVFYFKEKTFRLETLRSTADGSRADILLFGETEKNLSRDFPGENIFPRAAVSGDSFYVTWINYRRGGVSLCFYDSDRDSSRVLVESGFKFIGCDTGMVFDNHIPLVLIFKANDSGNDDLFAYSFVSGDIKALTRTPASEKDFRVDIKGAGAGPQPMNGGEVFPFRRDPAQDRPAHSAVEQGVVIETETLYHRCRYLFEPRTLEARLIYKEEIRRPAPGYREELTPAEINTYIAFGDSITWGKMRMNNLPFDPTREYHHWELAYPQKIKELLEPLYGYGIINYYNLGLPSETAYGGAVRVHGELAIYSGKYFLLMLGTNDAFTQKFSLASTLESLGYIVDAALSKNMSVIISTIPPRNDSFNIPRVVANIEALNAGIIAMAGQKNIKYIDTYTAFMNYNPPEGWKTLLEDRDASDDPDSGYGGQHPSPSGHQVITELFVTRILEYPPALPGNIHISKPGPNRIVVKWDENYEFDFSHYEIVFGYMPGDLNLSLSADNPVVTFIRPPFFIDNFAPRVYFRVRALDDGANSSGLGPVYSSTFQ